LGENAGLRRGVRGDTGRDDGDLQCPLVPESGQ